MNAIEDNFDLDNLQVRMLGYYIDNSPFLHEETDFVEFTNELSNRLSKTFDSIKDENNDSFFADAVNKYVFILKDLEGRLYAYWHKEHRSRVSNVVFNHDTLTQLPLEYKSWFIPGNEIFIRKIQAKRDFFDYVRDTFVGNEVSVRSLINKSEFNGVIDFVGNDFFSVLGNDGVVSVISKDFIITKCNSSQQEVPSKDEISFSSKKVSSPDNETSYHSLLEKYDKTAVNDTLELKPTGTLKFVIKQKRFSLKDLLTGSYLSFKENDQLVSDFQRDEVINVVHALRDGKLCYIKQAPRSITDILQDVRLEQSLPNAIEIVKNTVLSQYPKNISAINLKEDLEYRHEKEKGNNKLVKQIKELLENDHERALELMGEAYKLGYSIPLSLLEKIYQEGNENEKIFSFLTNVEYKIDINTLIQWLEFLLNSQDYETLDKLCSCYDENQVYKGVKAEQSVIYYYWGRSKSEQKKSREAALYLGSAVKLNLFNEDAVLYLANISSIDNEKLSNYIQTNSIIKKEIDDCSIPKFFDPRKYQDKILENKEYACGKNHEANPLLFLTIAKMLLQKESKEIDRISYFLIKYFYFRTIQMLVDGKKAYGTIRDFCLCFISLSSELKAEELVNLGVDLYIRSLFIERTGETIKKDYYLSYDYFNIYNYVLKKEKLLDSFFWRNLFKLSPRYISSDLQELAVNYIPADFKLFGIHIIREKKVLWNNCHLRISEFYKNHELINKPLSKDEIINELKNLGSVNTDILCEEEIQIITDIREKIYSQYSTFVNEISFELQSSYFQTLSGTLASVISSAKNVNTQFTLTYSLPLLLDILKIVKEDYSFAKEQAKPSFDISIVDKRFLFKNKISIQLKISLGLNSYPVRNLCVSLSSVDGVSVLEGGTNTINRLRVGDYQFMSVDISFDETSFNDMAFVLKCNCTYTDIDNQEEFQYYELKVDLEDEEQFEDFDNPFLIGGGKPLQMKHIDMFFGRDILLNEIISDLDRSNACQYLIYGQKRCGKSSFMNILKGKLEETGNFICVKVSFTSSDFEKTSKLFYYKLLSEIYKLISESKEKARPVFNFPQKNDYLMMDDKPSIHFLNCMKAFVEKCNMTDSWKNKKIVFLLDEFTNLYQQIKLQNFPMSFFQEWKEIVENEDCCFSTIIFGHDTIPMMLDEDYVRNPFSIFIPKHMTYLDYIDACNLIVNPILDKYGNSRYTGNSVDMIVDYTACNPYYIQMFCRELVYHVKKQKSARITEVDVKEVANELISNHFKGDKAFDNLVSCGEPSAKDYIQEYPEDKILDTLRAIARASKTQKGYCKRTDIKVNISSDTLDKYLENLAMRDVIEMIHSDQLNQKIVKIKVKLFEEWLKIN